MKVYKLTVPSHDDKTNKTHWREIGVLFADDSASGVSGCSIKLSMFPELKIKVYGMDKQNKQEPPPPEPDDPVDDLDYDDIPF